MIEPEPFQSDACRPAPATCAAWFPPWWRRSDGPEWCDFCAYDVQADTMMAALSEMVTRWLRGDVPEAEVLALADRILEERPEAGHLALSTLAHARRAIAHGALR